jgi:methyl coenzyme M reductase subunit C
MCAFSTQDTLVKPAVIALIPTFQKIKRPLCALTSAVRYGNIERSKQISDAKQTLFLGRLRQTAV